MLLLNQNHAFPIFRSYYVDLRFTFKTIYQLLRDILQKHYIISAKYIEYVLHLFLFVQIGPSKTSILQLQKLTQWSFSIFVVDNSILLNNLRLVEGGQSKFGILWIVDKTVLNQSFIHDVVEKHASVFA